MLAASWGNTGTMRIFNLSLPKSGTPSFGAMMRDAGHAVCDGNWRDHKTNFLMLAAHMGNYDLIDRVAHGYDMFSDAPFGGTLYYRQAAHTFPDAKFLLIKRAPEAWWASFAGMLDADVGADAMHDTLERKLVAAFNAGRYGYPLLAMDLCAGNATNDGFLHAKAAYEAGVEAFFEGNDRFRCGSMDAFADGAFNAFLGLEDGVKVPHMNPAKAGAPQG